MDVTKIKTTINASRKGDAARDRALSEIRAAAKEAIESHPLGKALSEIDRLRKENARIRRMYDDRLETEKALASELAQVTRQRDVAWARIEEGLLEHRRNLRKQVVKEILVHIDDIREWRKWLK